MSSEQLTNLNIRKFNNRAAMNAATVGLNDICVVNNEKPLTQLATMPTASADWVGEVVQYVGTDATSYIPYYFYKCWSNEDNPPEYFWGQIDVQYTPPSVTSSMSGVITLSATPQYPYLRHGNNLNDLISVDSFIHSGILVTFYTDNRDSELVVLITAASTMVKQRILRATGIFTNTRAYMVRPTATTNYRYIYFMNEDGSGFSSDTQFDIHWTSDVYGAVSQTYSWYEMRTRTSINSREPIEIDETQFEVMPTADASTLGDIIQYTGATDANYTNGYFYKGSSTITPSSATASQTTGSSLSDIAVNLSTFETQITTTGTYLFVRDGSYWTLNYGPDISDLEAQYGITYTGTPVSGDVITVDYTAAGTSYIWTRVNVQPAPVIPDPLPSQTGNAGKFLTTDGTDASWATINALQNGATGTDALAINSVGRFTSSIAIGNSVGSGSGVYWAQDVLIGNNADCACRGAVAIGYAAKAGSGSDVGEGSIAIGSGATVTRNSGVSPRAYGIAIGKSAQATETAIQIGAGTNNDVDTVKIANRNGNFEVMSADGTVPADRLTHAINKYSTMPTAASTNEGWIVQYTGATTVNYTHGYIYECSLQTVPSSAVGTQTAGSGLTDITVDASVYEANASTYGVDLTQPAVFTYDLMEVAWYYGNTYVGMFLDSALGIEYTGAPSNGDAITVVYTPQSTAYGWSAINTQPADYVPTSGGTMTGSLRFINQSLGMHGSIFGHQDGIKFGTVAQDGVTITTIGGWISTGLLPGANNTQTCGTSSLKWSKVYTLKINNGADISVPTTGGTMIVATPPTTPNTTWVLKATVDANGDYTVAWVQEV